MMAISPGTTSRAKTCAWAKTCLAEGVEWLQVREGFSSAREQVALAGEIAALRQSASGYEPLVSMSRRSDFALVSGLDGVHLPTHRLPLPAVRELLGDSMIIGCSVRTSTEAQRACDEGADYVLLGPVFSPRSKPQERPALGIELLRSTCKTSIPVYALGGVTIRTLGVIADAGAAGVAGISLFLSQAELGEAVARIKEHFPS